MDAKIALFFSYSIYKLAVNLVSVGQEVEIMFNLIGFEKN